MANFTKKEVEFAKKELAQIQNDSSVLKNQRCLYLEWVVFQEGNKVCAGCNGTGYGSNDDDCTTCGGYGDILPEGNGKRNYV